MPLRVRLTLWYGTALALILIIFSTILYVITARSLRAAVDQSLGDTAAAAVRVVLVSGGLARRWSVHGAQAQSRAGAALQVGTTRVTVRSPPASGRTCGGW